MSTDSQAQIRVFEDNEAPMTVDPASVVCGFMMFPLSMRNLVDASLIHRALETNQTDFWKAVRRRNPGIELAMMLANQKIDPLDVPTALDRAGKCPGASIVFNPMKMSPDGGRTFVDVYIGFCYASQRREVLVTGAQKVLPGQPRPATQAPPAKPAQTQPQVSQTGPAKKKWWLFWK